MSSEHTTPDTTEYAIEVNGLSKCYQIYDKPSDRLKQMLMRGRKQYYKEFWALKDVSFKIKKGETVGIIGRNGSGKSTLLQMICGTLNPTGGEVKVNGRVAALLELGAGFNPEFSGVENVYMAASLYGLSKEEVDQRFDAIATFADIGDHIHQPVKTYSSGMYVRLAFAVIAHVDANILVVDEALAVGDAFFTQKCMRFLRKFMEQGTVLFVSHDTGAVINLCKRAVWLNSGCLMRLGSPKVIAEDYLASLYKGSEKNTDSVDSDKVVVIEKTGNTELEDSEIAEPAGNYSADLMVFRFNKYNARAFGEGKAKIIDVKIFDKQKKYANQYSGGEIVTLKITAQVKENIYQPIIGFSFKDRLGQVLFGENTYAAYADKNVGASKNDSLVAEFEFAMPTLPPGDYSVSAAIATGTQQDHEQQHWIHDALVIKSITSSVSTGLVGIPMRKIKLELEK
jgi:lipopolysaccharide transport system ATP-binding protein